MEREILKLNTAGYGSVARARSGPARTPAAPLPRRPPCSSRCDPGRSFLLQRPQIKRHQEPSSAPYCVGFLNAMTHRIGDWHELIEQGSEKEGQAAADADRNGVGSDPGTTGTVHSANYSGMNKKQPC